MISDIEIAQRARPKKIIDVARDRLGIDEHHLEPFGHYKTKIDLGFIDSLKDRPDGRLILVTAMTPTPAGEGKTTTSVGLGDALNKIGKKTLICLREPSLGPCFGMKGGAAGGGMAQVLPMEDINLHFTGDFHAIGLAHNLLSALIDNHLHHGNELNIDPRRITWKRVVDMNDRALRNTVIGLGGPAHGVPRSDGFDIVVASEVMAIFCLATSLADLKTRLGNIIVADDKDANPVRARDLKADGPMAVLLKDALKPNLVQTLEGNPALIHGGPFANIAHGCNSLIATKSALKLADYVVTEAGFGADLGAEKFIDIKCRKAGLVPDVAVVVATVRALKYHGGIAKDELATENVEAVNAGLANLERHVENVRYCFGLPCVVAINRFSGDTTAEINAVFDRMKALETKVVLADHWANGGDGAVDLANAVVETIECERPNLRFAYEDADPLWEKISSIAAKIYRADGIVADAKVRKAIDRLQENGHGNLPVCIAKTQYSFTSDPAFRGAPDKHVLQIREIRLNAGAEFVVAVCGEIMTMPGLPRIPAANQINIDDEGKVIGLF